MSDKLVRKSKQFNVALARTHGLRQARVAGTDAKAKGASQHFELEPTEALRSVAFEAYYTPICEVLKELS